MSSSDKAARPRPLSFGSLFKLPPGFYAANDPVSVYDVLEDAGYCDNRCVFCLAQNFGRLSKPAENLRIHPHGGASGEHKKIHMCSWEPTNLPDIAGKIRQLKASGYETVAMTTHGRRLQDAAFAASLAEAGIDEIYFSVLGPTAALHDAVTQIPGSFDELIAGMRNAVALRNSRFPNLRLGINAVVTRSNLSPEYWLAMLLRAEDLQVRFVNLIMLVPIALGKVLYAKEMPNYDDIFACFHRLKARATEMKKLADLRVVLMHFPYCLADSEESLSFLMTPKSGSFRDAARSGLVEHSACKICPYEPYCDGISPEYAQVHGVPPSLGLSESSRAEAERVLRPATRKLG